MSEVKTKKCSQCGEEKPATNEFFRKDSRRPDSLHSWCRLCSRKSAKNWRQENLERARENYKRWHTANIERERERHKAYNRANAEKRSVQGKKYRTANREKINRANRLWQRANREQLYRRKRVWLAANRQRMQAHSRAYATANRDKRRILEQRRRARKRSLSEEFTIVEWQRALDYFHGCCAVCGRMPGLSHSIAADHWIPLNSPECPGTIPTNIVPLCHGRGGCNNSKSAKDPETWLIERFGEHEAKQITERIKTYFTWVKNESSN